MSPSYLHWLAGGSLFPLCHVSWPAGNPQLHLPSGRCVRHKVGRVHTRLTGRASLDRAGAEGGQGRVRSVPPGVTRFDTMCASGFVGKGHSAPKIKIDLIYLPVGKTETRGVNGLPDIQGSGVAQPGQNPGSLKRGLLSPSQLPEMTVSAFVS